ncbi:MULTISPECIES: SMI1/KNR4 family protein [unclassified Bacillus cereus group]|uniref:SMI1/KNR4 family protein n=1 Tax=unclassified Bacillus cereus group TaxID=2750818 RepID=UPI0033935A35
MENINQLIKKVKSLPNCRVQEPTELPIIDKDKHMLPGDLKEFYSLCGGLTLFENEEYPIRIVTPEEFILANPVIVGELCEEDISSNWYIICNDGKDEYLTIDLSEERLGRCYDSFFDRHGIVGETEIIATSFTDLLEKLIKNNGQYWYWLKSEFESLGDAYDDQE